MISSLRPKKKNLQRKNLLSMILILLLCLPASAKIIDRVLAVVSNEVVTLSDLGKFKRTLESGGMFDERLFLGKKKETVLASRRATLDVLINQKILDVEVKRRGMETPIEKVEQEISSIARRNGLNKSQLLEALRVQGMSLKTYRAFLRKSIERQSLLEAEILSRVKISEEDIASYFSKHNRLGQDKIFEYTISQIFFDKKKGGKNAARERSEIILGRLKTGEPFETLADQTSEEVNPSSGGLLGTFRSGEFAAHFENAVKNLDVGSYSSVIKSQTGFHIIKLVNRKLITDPAYEKERKQVISILQQQEFNRLFKDWLENRRQELFVRYNND